MGRTEQPVASNDEMSQRMVQTPGSIQSTENGRWRRVPAARVAMGRAPGADAMARVRLGAGLALAVGAAWLAWNWLAPLPGPARGEAEQPRLATVPMAARPDAGTRKNAVDGLAAGNMFDAQRRAWNNPATVDATQTTLVTPGNQTAAVSTDPNLPAVENPDTLAAELKAAWQNLGLRGLRRRGDGVMVAMISFNNPGPAKAAPTAGGTPAAGAPGNLVAKVVAEGEAFQDPAFAGEDWKLTAVDTEGRRAIVTRGGKNLELKLFSAALPRPAAPKFDQVGQYRVERLERAQVEARLRAGGLTPAQIAELMKKVDEAPDAKAATAGKTGTSEAGTGAAKPAEQTAQKGFEPTPPPATKDGESETMSVNDLFKMLMSNPGGQPGAKPKDEKKPEAEPKK